MKLKSFSVILTLGEIVFDGGKPVKMAVGSGFWFFFSASSEFICSRTAASVPPFVNWYCLACRL
jgi:hypothetical protein